MEGFGLKTTLPLFKTRKGSLKERVASSETRLTNELAISKGFKQKISNWFKRRSLKYRAQRFKSQGNTGGQIGTPWITVLKKDCEAKELWEKE